MPAVLHKLPPNAFLSDVRTYNVDLDGVKSDGDDTFDALVTKAVASGNPELVIEPQNSNRPFRSAIAIPIYRSETVASVVVLATAGNDDSTGVFEIWSPIGEYQELSLSGGYFGNLARFQNVSSFVRFERGTGLPGQVWNGFSGVIHDDLSNHPGFLRAAGASADSLSTAIGIPVCGTQYVGSVLLISSSATPIARGFEVWKAGADAFTLQHCAYASDEIRLEIGTKLSITGGLLGQTREAQVAVISDDPSTLIAGRQSTAAGAVTSGIAIPFYQGADLTSVTVLLF